LLPLTADLPQVLDSWDAEEDSEVEREKAKKAAEAKAKADAAAKAAKKSKTQRIEDRIAENKRLKALALEPDSDDSEDEAAKKARLRKEQKDADLAHAMDLFGDLGMGKRGTDKAITTVADPSNPASTIELSALAIFKPETPAQFRAMRETLEPLLLGNAKKGPYLSFLQEFVKTLARELPADQIKKVASGLTTLSNEKLKEEKAAEKGGKKSKAAKTKATLKTTRDVSSRAADLEAYDDDGMGE